MNRRDTIRLAMLPTPFEQMPRLSLALGRDGQILASLLLLFDTELRARSGLHTALKR